MAEQNGNGNGNGEKWISVYRSLSVLLLGGILFFAQKTHDEIKQQGADIVKIQIDGADVKSSLRALDWRVGKLEERERETKQQPRK